MRVTPPRYRFGVAKVAARCVARLLAHKFSPSRSPRPAISSVRDRCLGEFVYFMDTQGFRFDPVLRVSGVEVIESARREGRGVLLISTHANANLATLLVRQLDGSGFPLSVVSTLSPYPIFGSAKRIEAIKPAGDFLVTVRTRLRAGDVVCAVIDSGDRTDERQIEVRTTYGSLWLSDSIVRLAQRCNARIVFCAAHVDRRWDLQVTLRAPSNGRPDDVIYDFVSFVERHIADTVQ